jgi:hypothetical protein
MGSGQLPLCSAARQPGHPRDEQALASQASYEIQPRVFYEDFKNTVLYVQNVRSGTGAANWRQVFMADVTDPTTPKITTAASATVVSDSTTRILMRLRNGPSTNSLCRPAGSIQHLHLRHHRSALHSEPAEAKAPGPHGYGHLRLPMANCSRAPRPRRQAIPHRVAQPLRLSRGMPGADAGGRSAGRHLAARRQKLGLGLHHPAGLLYYSLSLTGTALGQAELDPAFVAVWLGQHALCRRRPVSAVADGQRRPRVGAIASFTSRTPKPAAPAESNGVRSPGFSSRFSPRCSATSARQRLSAHPRRIRRPRVPQHVSSGAHAALSCSCWCSRSSTWSATSCATTFRSPIVGAVPDQPHPACSTRSRRWRCSSPCWSPSACSTATANSSP